MKPALITALGVAALLCGCGGGPSHITTESFYLVCTNTKIPYWQEANAGFLKAARELKVKAEMVGPDTYDPQAQKEEFRKAVAKKPSGILVSPGNSEVLREDINAAIAAGIPVITMDSDAPKSQRLFFVGTNNYQAGLMGGRLAVKLLNGKGNIVIYTIAGQENLDERMQGYQAAFEGHAGIKIVEVIDMKGDPRQTFDKTMEIVEKRKDQVDAFISLEALSGSEVAEVLDRNRVEGKIVIAMDTSAQTLQWIEKGRIAATVGQKPYTMGYYGLRVLADLVLYKPASLTAASAGNVRAALPVFVDTGTLLVDKSNVTLVKSAAE